MIKIENLWFSYNGSNNILNDINLEIADGEYVSIIGENGCGKTTLMRVILGFLKTEKGKITIESKQVGYVPQRNDFSNSSFPITVHEVLKSYAKILKIKDKTVIERVLKVVGMDEHSKNLMGNLSGGQTQKILIARALMGTPKLLILDEPSTGVDVESQNEIYGLLKKLSSENKITVLAVEHNMNAAFKYSTKIFHLKNGYGHLCNPEKYAKEYLHL